MKKFICVVLSVFMLASLGFSAFAQDWEDEWVDIDCSAAGVTLMLPSSLLFNSQGTVDVLLAEELGYKSGVYVTYLGYIGVTSDEYYNGDYEEDSYAPLLQLVGLKENYDSNAFSGTNLHIDLNQAYDIGTIGDVTFYALIGTDVLPAGIQSPYAEEYEFLLQCMNDVIENSYFFEPIDPYAAQAGTSAAFQTIDLDGNAVNSADLFAQNEITLVNLWATWCPHCIEELPDLAQIHQQLQGIGCGIVGLLADDSDAETLAEAKSLLAEASVTYPCIVMPDGGDELFPSSGLPCSYFVNRNGEIVGTPIQGKQVDKYYEAVQDLLNGGTASIIVTDAPGAVPIIPAYEASIPGFGATMGSLSKEKGAIAPASGTEYRVICVDESGNPVVGAAVQFCSDTSCMMGKTDENGIAVFDVDPGHYTVHLLKPPAGYAKDSTEYETPTIFGDVTIVVKAA